MVVRVDVIHNYYMNVCWTQRFLILRMRVFLMNLDVQCVCHQIIQSAQDKCGSAGKV